MPRLLLFLAIVGVAVIVYALFDCIMSRANEIRSISKPAWILTIILVPLLGAGLWFLFGRPRSGGGAAAQQRTVPRHPTAPDDDPQFLRNLETRRRQQAREAELRRREEELKANEQEKNDDGAPGDEDPDAEDPRQGPGSKTA